jgi:hypothetical protein
MGEEPGVLEQRAEDRARAGDYTAAVALRERAFAAWRARGDVRRAAYLAAYQIAFDHHALFGNQAVAQGWLERGTHLAQEAGECAEAGWVALSRALHTEDRAVRGSLVAEATRLAQHCGDTALAFDALAYTGLMLVEDGRVSDGMRRLDEAAAAARGGEVADPVVAGEIYCKLLVACERTLDVRRAEEWHPVAASFGDRPEVGVGVRDLSHALRRHPDRGRAVGGGRAGAGGGRAALRRKLPRAALGGAGAAGRAAGTPGAAGRGT